MPQTRDDVIGGLAGIAAGSALDTIRDLRPEARKHAQASYRALFEPDDTGGFAAQDRWAIATFVAGVHDRPESLAFYEAGLADAGATEAFRAALKAEIAIATVEGPYGDYPPGPLTAENAAGPVYRVSDDGRRLLGERLASALEHVHMLVFHPRDSAPPSLAALLAAGWSTTDIVTLSQLVAFLSYQIRVVAGLRVLAGQPSA